jgi:GTP-binding protein HflX
MEIKRTELSVGRETALLVGVLLPGSSADPRDPLGELASLARTAGARVAGQIIQKRARVDPSTYVGSGKALEIARLAMANDANVVLFDNDLSPGQIGALEKIINEEAGSRPGEAGIKVLDRSELILDIFASRAQTHEARLQVELAQMQYTYPRLMKMWSHLERIAGGGAAMGGIGTRGPGETQLEVDRRLVRNRVADLKRQIARIQERKTRQVHDRNRQHFTVGLVGYTNAGKSTLFNTLTSAGAYADDKLFATLDTRTRAWDLEKGARAMLSDTVGFVRDLPHHLVASFRATLEEAVNADLLLHVLDVGHPRARQQFDSVQQVLQEIGAGSRPQLLLLNKIDDDAGRAAMYEWRALHRDAIPLSARTGEGIDALHRAVLSHVRGQRVTLRITCDLTDGRLISRIESETVVRQRRFVDGMAEFVVFVGRNDLEPLSRIRGLSMERLSDDPGTW